jgi:hypothetical protein
VIVGNVSSEQRREIAESEAARIASLEVVREIAEKAARNAGYLEAARRIAGMSVARVAVRPRTCGTRTRPARLHAQRVRRAPCGGGRPRGRSQRSCCRSGSSGDDGLGEPEPAGRPRSPALTAGERS